MLKSIFTKCVVSSAERNVLCETWVGHDLPIESDEGKDTIQQVQRPSWKGLFSDYSRSACIDVEASLRVESELAQSAGHFADQVIEFSVSKVLQ